MTFIAFAALNCWGRAGRALRALRHGTCRLQAGIFFAITGPRRDARIFAAPLLPFGARGIFLALPFAIWFYLALERRGDVWRKKS